jgi:hypothetical protein
LNIVLNSESEKAVLENYAAFMVVKEGSIPSIKQIYELTKQYMDANCYDLIYPEIFSTMTEDLVGIILDKNKYVHINKDGVIVYEAQNKLFDDWFYFQRLMLQG